MRRSTLSSRGVSDQPSNQEVPSFLTLSCSPDIVQCSAHISSSKVIEKPTLEPCEKDDELISEGKEGVESEHCKEKTDSLPALPFPHAMTKQRKVNRNSKIFETFKQVRINIPLLDAIKQVPSYANFLKDLCTVKRKLNVKKKAFLAE